MASFPMRPLSRFKYWPAVTTSSGLSHIAITEGYKYRSANDDWHTEYISDSWLQMAYSMLFIARKADQLQLS